MGTISMSRILKITVALALASVAGCAAPGQPDARRARMSPGLLFNAAPGGANPASFVRAEWPSTPHKWIVEEESATLRETTWDCQHPGRGHGWHHRHSRSERRLRARAAD